MEGPQVPTWLSLSVCVAPRGKCFPVPLNQELGGSWLPGSLKVGTMPHPGTVCNCGYRGLHCLF